MASAYTDAKSPRHDGLALGEVTSVDDPRRMGRVKVTCPDVAGQLELAWARVCLPFAGPGAGIFPGLVVGSRVVVGFEAGDHNRPVVVGMGWDQVGGQSNLPAAALGEPDSVRDGRGTDSASGAGGKALSEPSDPYAPVYPSNNVWKTAGGHLVELDDTEGAERISITHGQQQTWIEFHPDGSMVIGTSSKLYTRVGGDAQTHVNGDQDVVVDGDGTFKSTEQRVTVQNLTVKTIKKALLEVLGNVEINAKQGAKILSPDIELGIDGAPKGALISTQTYPFDFVTGFPIPGIENIKGG